MMQSPVLAIGVRASLRQAAIALRDGHVGVLVVMDDGDATGVLSERDIVRAIAGGADPDAADVGSVRSEGPRYATPSDSPAAALSVMLDAGIRHLPVIEEDELVGIVSMRDVARALAYAVGDAPRPADG